MRFLYLELNNYIGIYNGMGLYQIKIDFSKAFHRICVIKGTNGSGKTTIQSALSLFPDGSESFIPDKSASKIIRVKKLNTIYEIKFFHDLRPNGGRIPTKAFISKLDESGNMIEMNPNGNVTSYKDILLQEFNLDSNFFALTKLSMDDRGLGYKKPADRKRFVNSIIESLEVYNDIYKTISKKANNLKAVMNNITSRLGSIGDKVSLTASRDAIDTEIASLNSQRDQCQKRIAEIDANINILDPDSSIQETFKSISSSLKKIQASLEKSIMSYKSENKIFIPEVESKLLGDNLEKCYKGIAYLEKEMEKIKSSSKSILDQMASIRSQLDLTISQLSTLKSDEYKKTEKEQAKFIAQAQEIFKEIEQTGIDPNAFTKDEYILALETVHDIVSMVDLFRSTFSYDMINLCISDYASLGYVGMPEIRKCDAERNLIQSSAEQQQRFISDIARVEADLQLTSKLEHRPELCKIDSCFFIADAVQILATNPKKRLEQLTTSYEAYKEELQKAYHTVEWCDTYNQCINQIRTIIRSIDKNQHILTRLPNGGIFSSKATFFEQLAGGQSFEYIDRVYKYINFANLVDQYHTLMNTINQYKIRLESLSANKESMRKFEEVKVSLLQSIGNLQIRLDANRQIIDKITETLNSANAYAKYLNEVVIPRCDAIIQSIQQRDEYLAQLTQIQSQMADINQYTERRTEAVAQLKVVESQIAYKQKEKDEIGYKLKQIEEYEESLKKYQEIYSKYYEKIKYHSSPTTGIQLVFMQLYMGKILEMSNNLLSYLFGGQYQLQPFIINEDEFRIPCMGNGYLNDDISSMSSSQLTMISMILSFALLAVSSTDYNIIKLDEIDDPLDEPNRAAFAMLLDNIMDAMHTEQCIMISHSSEMITNNADIILLRSDGITSVDPNANVIWDFNNQ